MEKGPRSNTFLPYDWYSPLLAYQLTTVCECEGGNTRCQLETGGVWSVISSSDPQPWSHQQQPCWGTDRGAMKGALSLLQSRVFGQTWLDSIPHTALITHPGHWAGVHSGTPTSQISFRIPHLRCWQGDTHTHTLRVLSSILTVPLRNHNSFVHSLPTAQTAIISPKSLNTSCF